MITQADLIERFGAEEIARLSDHDEYRTINAAVVEKAITDAVAEVNSYLAPVGLVGITPPKALVLKACDIARHRNRARALQTGDCLAERGDEKPVDADRHG